MSPFPELVVRALVDRYRVEREIGRGGMATVYLAEDLKHGRRIAIKVFSAEYGSLVGRERFVREIEIAARLNHPHILPLFDPGSADDVLYYTMPYVEGESLRARLERETRLSVDDALRLAGEVGRALDYAHRAGVVHRDVKPENILLSQGIALVADFGIARALRAARGDAPGTYATQTGLALGSPHYMSPEQLNDEELDGRADLYALACVLHEILTGEPPFTGPTLAAVIRGHLLTDPTPITALRPDVPRGVADAIARGLAKHPSDRHPTGAGFRRALEARDAPAGGGAYPWSMARTVIASERLDAYLRELTEAKDERGTGR